MLEDVASSEPVAVKVKVRNGEVWARKMCTIGNGDVLGVLPPAEREGSGGSRTS